MYWDSQTGEKPWSSTEISSLRAPWEAKGSWKYCPTHSLLPSALWCRHKLTAGSIAMENSEGNHRFELGVEAAVLLLKAAVVAAAKEYKEPVKSWKGNVISSNVSPEAGRCQSFTTRAGHVFVCWGKFAWARTSDRSSEAVQSSPRKSLITLVSLFIFLFFNQPANAMADWDVVHLTNKLAAAIQSPAPPVSSCARNGWRFFAALHGGEKTNFYWSHVLTPLVRSWTKLMVFVKMLGQLVAFSSFVFFAGL